MTAITGRNGAGKTTVLSCLEAGITGDWGCFPGNKGSNVAQLADPGAPASVTLDVEFGGRGARIVRGLRPDLVEFHEDGRPAEVGKARVNALVEEALGVPLAVVSAHGFVRQRTMFDFISTRAADRAAALRTLTGVDRAEKAYVLLGRELQDAPLLIDAGERDALLVRIADLEAGIAAADAEIAARPNDYPAALAARRTAAVAERRAREARTDAVAARVEFRRLRRRARAEDRDFQLAGIAAARADSEAAEAKGALRAATVSRDSAREYAKALDVRLVAIAERDAAERAAAVVAASRPPVPVPAARAEDAALAEVHAGRRLGLYASITADRAFIRSFRDGRAECPTCGTPVATFADRLAETDARVRVDEEAYAAGEAAFARVKADADAAAASEARLARWAADVAAADRRVADLRVPPEPDAPTVVGVDAEAAWAGASEAAGFANERAREAHSTCRVARARTEVAEEARDAARDARAGALAVVASLPRRKALREALEAANTRLDAAMANLDELNRLVGGRLATSRELDAARERLAVVEAAGREAVGRAEWRDAVREARDLVHRDGLPRAVMLAFLARVEGGVNANLERFDARFRVTASDDLSFAVAFDDGRVQDASRLSPGEKTVLALAYRVAVNPLFARDLGVLALDEPTDGLDSENVAVVGRALEALREVSEERGLQVFVVTHDRRLTDDRFCDDVLDLGVD